MKQLTIYDPAMCCTTGVCGPSPDPELARFAQEVRKLEAEGLKVLRYNLGQDPKPFTAHEEVARLLNDQGPEVLPIILADDTVMKTGAYPTAEELAQWAGTEAEEIGRGMMEITPEMKELIAVAASVAAGCEPCLKYHYNEARKLAVPKSLMMEAADIGDMVKQAASRNMINLAERLMGAPAAEKASDAGGCCSGGGNTPGCC